ncbi:TonB-dependent siderophore receptor [Chroococcidiopsis sp. CCMEE 29]|uniref:TonB-dependent siderophore receptor n=1 Tax=Chroococcidiopsis sp. CCMEE 29 TaxID=155894 RepID=UPI002021B09F|nr:TonB-dependent siderophore receptor [Chroococcidiopsis sp. CCMEE 29]
MKQLQLFHGLWLTGSVVAIAAQPVWADVIPVTAVRFNPTATGLEVILQTPSGQPLQVLTTSDGNTLIAHVINAQLRLPDSQAFRADNPATGISTVTVTQQATNSIRVAIAGMQAVPTAKVVPGGSGVVLSINTTPAKLGEATAPPEATDQIEILVTGERDDPTDDYRVPEAAIGTRTDTPRLNVPASIQVVPEQVIEDQRATDLSEALRNVSGLTTASSSRDIFSNFTIRGFETGNTFLRNGIPDNDIGRLGFDFANVERLEVLKGPASVLYGQIAPGGVVNIVTKQPLPFPFYDLEATYGSFNTYQGAFDFSGPLNDSGTLIYRLNGSVYGSDTFIDEIDIDRYLIAPVLTWLIGENTSLTLEAEYLDAQYPNERGLPIEGTIEDNPNGEIPRSRYLGEPAFDRNERRSFRIGYDFEHRFSENWQFRNVFRFLWEEDNQDSVGPRDLLDGFRTQQRQAFIQLGPSFANSYEAVANITGNFTTGGIKHQLLFGVDFSTEFSKGGVINQEIGNIDIFNPVYNQPLGAIISTSRSESRFETLGFYVQDQITFADNFILVLGGRYDNLEQEEEDLIEGTSSSQEDDAFSPRVGLVYKPIETVAIYGSYSRSFEQVTGTNLDDQLFEPQRGTQYEVGVKADLLDGRLFTTLAFYDLTLSNVLTPDPRDLDFSIQTGKQRSRGIELDIAGEILPGWQIIAGYGYTNAEVIEDNEIPEGNRLVNVPEHAVSLWTKYEIQNGNLQGLGFGFGLFYVGERAGDLDNTFDLPSYLRTDAAVYYRRDNFRAQLNFKNLFDIDYFETANGRNRIFYGAPFEVLATVGWEF